MARKVSSSKSSRKSNSTQRNLGGVAFFCNSGKMLGNSTIMKILNDELIDRVRSAFQKRLHPTYSSPQNRLLEKLALISVYYNTESLLHSNMSQEQFIDKALVELEGENLYPKGKSAADYFFDPPKNINQHGQIKSSGLLFTLQLD